MKMAITADLHLNNNTYQITDPDSGLYVKSLDAVKAFEWFVNESISKEVDRVVIIGDIYNNSDPTEAIRSRLSRQLQKLAANDIQVVVLTGNHDFCSKYHALESFKGWDKLIKILDTPFVEDGVATYIPHTLDIERRNNDFRSVIDNISQVSNEKHIFFGHFAVRGAMRDNLSSEDGGGAVSTVDIEATGASIAFLGHFHKYQRITSNIPVYYVGSIENHRMNDMDGKRGFFIYDTESGEYERIDYENHRPMRILEVDGLDTAMMMFEDGNWEDFIVRLDVIGEHVDFLKVRDSIQDIKRLFFAAGGCHIYSKDKTGTKNSSGKKIEIESIDQIDVLATLESEVKSRLKDDEEECAVTLDLLKEIHAEETKK